MNEEDLRLAKVLVGMELENKNCSVRKTVIGKVKEKVFRLVSRFTYGCVDNACCKYLTQALEFRQFFILSRFSNQSACPRGGGATLAPRKQVSLFHFYLFYIKKREHDLPWKRSEIGLRSLKTYVTMSGGKFVRFVSLQLCNNKNSQPSTSPWMSIHYYFQYITTFVTLLLQISAVKG